MVKILAALSILNSSGASLGATKKVAALVVAVLVTTLHFKHDIVNKLNISMLIYCNFDSRQSRHFLYLSYSYHSSPSLQLLHSDQVRLGDSCWIGPLNRHRPFGHVSCVFKKAADILAPRLSVVFRRLLQFRIFLNLLETGRCHPNFKGSTFLYRCQSFTNIHSTCTVRGV